MNSSELNILITIIITAATTPIQVFALEQLCLWVEKSTPARWRLITAAIVVGLPNVILICGIIELSQHPAGGQTGWPIVMFFSALMYRALIVKSLGNGFKIWFLQLPIAILIALIACH